jgi:hypothetical protein
MNSMGVWYDPTTWFDDEPASVGGTGGSYTTNPATDPFGWSSWFSGGQSTDVVGGISDSDLSAWNNYWSSGGVMNANLGGTGSTTSGTTSSDIFGGLTDFFGGLTSAVNFGLSTYANIQQIIAQANPDDQLVTLPGSSVPVVKRTVSGQTSYYPITQLYPNLAPQVQQAQQSSWVGPVLLAGVAGLGLFLILKKK